MSTDNTYQIPFLFKDKRYILDVSKIAQQDKKTACNLQVLFSRKKGTLLQVTENGYLAPVKGIKGRISYELRHSDKKKCAAEDEKLKNVIDSAIVAFNRLLSESKDEEVAKFAARYLFDKSNIYGIGRLSKALYNHKLIKCDNTLSKHLLPPKTIRLKLSDHRFVKITSKELPDFIDPFPLVMNLGNETANHNFKMLLKRKKGTIYQVDHQGKLIKAKGLWHWHLSKTARDEKVQAAVTEVIKALNTYVKTHSEVSHTHKIVLRHFFSHDSPLCRMSKKTFDRGSIKENSDLEKLLQPELQKTRHNLIQALCKMRDTEDDTAKPAARRDVERALFEHTYCEFLFAQKLGLDLERIGDGGTGGARFAYDRHRRKILVIKPEDEGPLGVNNPKWYARIKRFLVSPKACLEGNSEAMAELHSWSWDRHFNIWVVPPTDVRHVGSKNFVGDSVKLCSIQMFVEDCQTLGEYVGVSKYIQWLPRRFLRWYCGSRFDSGLFYIVGQRETKKQELIDKLPISLIERVAIHNMGIEDIDCHVENILCKTRDVSLQPTILDSIFNGDQKITDLQIQGYVTEFFNEKGNQHLLDNLLYSAVIPAKEGKKEQKLTLIKHDGGASNPRSHPEWWDILSLRYKHFFEVLPHFEEMFSFDGKALINDKANYFCDFLLEKATRSLRDILAPDVFSKFWQDEDNRACMKEWIFELDEDKAFIFYLELIRALFQATGESAKQGPYYQFYFDYHLTRIKSCLKTRMDSFCVLSKYVNSDKHNMRAMFINVACESDFENQLQKIASDPKHQGLKQHFQDAIHAYKTMPVQAGSLPQKDLSDPLDTRVILKGFGVKL